MSAPSLTPGSQRLKQRALLRAQPLNAHLELTYRCNWRCVFCYNPRHADLRGMRAADWAVVLDDLRALGTLTVSLTGGEPLTHPEFFEIAAGVRRRAMALRILTNGALVTHARADAIAVLRPIAVEMSVHGSRPETHDRTTAQPGSFTAMLEGLDRLRSRGVPVLLKSPLTRMNEDELDGMIALAEERGVPFHVDPTLTPRDDGDPSPLGYAASAAGLERLFRRLATLGRLPMAAREKDGLNCGLGRVTLAVDPEGNVYPCLQWRKTSLGNVHARPLRELWRSSPMREEAAAVAGLANDRLFEAGGAVSRFPFCPALAYQRTGDPLLPDDDHVQRALAADRVRQETA
jgi:MoaA/NifB/PqqE/SkfB family radical SAM enzyme